MQVLRRTDLLARRAQQHGHPLPAHRLFGLQGRRDDRRRHAARHHDGVQASGTDSHGPPRSGSASPGCSALTCPTALRQETRPPGQGHEPAPTRPIRRDPIAAQYNQMIKYAAGSAPEPPSPRPSCANQSLRRSPRLPGHRRARPHAEDHPPIRCRWYARADRARAAPWPGCTRRAALPADLVDLPRSPAGRCRRRGRGPERLAAPGGTSRRNPRPRRRWSAGWPPRPGGNAPASWV